MPAFGSRSYAAVAGVAVFFLAQGATAQDGGFDFYGHLNFGILNYDDGAQSKNYFVDNDNSNSRIGFRWDPDTASEDGWRFQFETALGFLGSSDVNVAESQDAIDFGRTDLRIFEAVYATAEIGKVSLGQGSMATDGITGNEFVGTGVIAGPSIADLAGSQILREAGGALSGLTIGNVSGDLEGARRFRVRYDTPSFGGVTLSAAAGREVLRENVDTEYYDAALRYVGDFGDVTTAFGVGYGAESGGRRVTSGSAAILHVPTGLSLQLTGGVENDGPSYTYVRAGVRRDWLDLGETRVSLDFYDGKDFASVGSETDSWALALVQIVESAGVEAYAIVRDYGFTETTTAYQDGQAIMLGARWRF